MPINGVVESKLRFLERYEQIEPQIVYGLAKGKLGCFRDFVDEIRRACAGEGSG
jgi:uncharacterized protein YutE (UPF0331/DUF86 family)